MGSRNKLCQRPVLLVIMDGLGERAETFGNAVYLARTPVLNFLRKNAAFTTLKAHGPYVGLPSDQDMGNSEVGHNALGAGRIYDQGAKLLQESLKDGSLFKGETWKKLLSSVRPMGALHFIGLLSDGHVHSHEKHLYAMMRKACQEGVKKIRVHVLFDGRDVAAKSAEVYIERLEKVLAELQNSGCDARAASGGGRMYVTMDRYEADWSIVERGWRAHVLGESLRKASSLSAVVQEFRTDSSLTDQFFPDFVIEENGKPVGMIEDGDSVLLFNFRGDRAIEISRAFEDSAFPYFDRVRRPDVFYAGMLEYDGDLHIPKSYLVAPPAISDTLGQHLASLGVRQFACSETQKFGHVTYFWNGNRSGYFDQNLEEYLEIPSDRIAFEKKPWMKAYEITEATIQRMRGGSFDFLRINLANPDMVGHTGDLEAAIQAVATVDKMLFSLLRVCQETKTILVATADHGNCEEMFEAQSGVYSSYEQLPLFPEERPRAKTSHTLSEVPFFVFDPSSPVSRSFQDLPDRGLAHVANTILDLLGLKTKDTFLPSLLR